ncbi:MAG TPA: ParB/RepB/Spo0J family partition protein [Spirochaetales bacterium]|nr:putative chromosome-partitioning protein ParB [uncultured Spirochaetota bacterium]HOI22497.1 ParB/RepB/Spo0J family partition protein [Spirochaetales bacterium]
MAKFGLGKGLGALIPEHQQYFDSSRNPLEPGENIQIIPLSRLKPNPDQPRKTFSEASIEELAQSIQKHGLLQPIIAEPSGGDSYIIVAGERRFRAAQKAGLEKLPVILRAVSAEKRLQLSLIENIQREDLNPMEEARAYQGLMELTGYTQEQVAEAVGKNRSTVANALRLLRLPEVMQEAVRDGSISAGHARSLLALVDESERQALFARIVKESLSVRQAEKAVQDSLLHRTGKKPKGGKKTDAVVPAEELDPNLKALEELFIERLGTKVEIKGGLNSGSILIEYYSQDDLQRIMEAIGSGE